MATLEQSILAAFAKDEAGHAAVTACAKKSVRQALASGNFDGVRFMLANVTRNYRDSVPAFFAKAGMTIVMSPGGVKVLMDEHLSKKAGDVHAWLDKAETIVGYAPDDVRRKAKTVRADADTLDEADKEARKLIESSIARLKKAGRQNVAAALNDLVCRAPEVVKTFPALTLISADGVIADLLPEDYEVLARILVERRFKRIDASTQDVLRVAA